MISFFVLFMKRIEAIISPNMRDKVVSAIKKVGVGGVTVWHAEGQGKADPPLVGQYFTRAAVVAVVDDSKVNSVLETISKIACTGTKGDGKVFVTPIEEALDICTKEKGPKAI